MTTLILGGTGNVGLPLARLLHDAHHPVLIASRSPAKVPEPFKGVAFDWFDPSTYKNPFAVDSNITRVFIITPQVVDKVPAAKEFVELAISKGVKRFVLLSASSTPRGGLFSGKVHDYLAERGVEYVILRPTWFFENFNTVFVQPIRQANFIPTTAEDGKVPFVSAHDIAQVAFRALVGEQHGTEHIIVGPELYTYDEVAAALSEALGRTITHKRLSQEEAKAAYQAFGIPEDYALGLLELERLIRVGNEEAFFHAEVKEVGKKHLKEYIQDNREAWVV